MSSLCRAQIILIGFFLLILTGAILLTLPISSKSGEFTPFSDALFTSTSATCVTGLIVYDTYQHWSFFGQFVIMMLIQIGGLGFFVWKDIREHGLKFRQYRLHTKLVLITSLCLVVFPALFFFVEFSHPEWSSLTRGERIWASLFQTVTPVPPASTWWI